MLLSTQTKEKHRMFLILWKELTFITPLTFNTVEIKLDKLAVLQSNKKWEILQSRDPSWMCSLCAEYHVLARTGVNVSLICWHPDYKLFLWLMCWLNINICLLTVSIKVDCVCCHWCPNSCLVWVKSWPSYVIIQWQSDISYLNQ